MSDDTQDDRMNAAIRDAAQSYNTPPATPRDEMWARIQARRAVPAARRIEPARPRWGWLSAAAAAVLLAGIGIGYSLRGGSERDLASQQRIARGPSASAAYPDSSAATAAGGSRFATREPSDTDAAGRASGASGSGASASGPRGVGVTREQQVASAPVGRRTAPRGVEPATPRDIAPDLAYRLAVVDHLARTEALLTSFRAEARNGTVDAQIGGWARDLLRTTRLMESSAETRDPTMRRLLGDLELVLVQIAQYSATTQGSQRGEELDLIEQSIDRRGVLGKLRAAIPPGMIPAGT